jgi:ABC-type nitrate/sulfonate/bicarbonate transport system substrate-binding protein
VRSLSGEGPFKVGFVPTIDCAPLVVAQEAGLFRKWGVPVRLIREVGWASIRDRLLHQELHAAHASATMAFAMRCGLGSLAVPCLTSVILAYNGSAITISAHLASKGGDDPAALRALVREPGAKRKFRLAAVFHYSTQHENLRRWLRSCGLEVGADVDIVVMPSSLVHKSLAGGYIDGFCVAEPWSSVSEAEGVGRIALPRAGGEGMQVEKVLLVLERFEREFPEAHQAMVCAVLEAAALCEQPEFAGELVAMLRGRAYLDAPEMVLRRSLAAGTGEGAVGGIRYGAGSLGAPTRDRGVQVFEILKSIGVPESCRSFRRDVVSKIFREDLFTRAWERLPFHPPAGADQGRMPVQSPSFERSGSKAA